MSFLGNYLEGEQGKSVRFGYVDEGDKKGKAAHKVSSLIFQNAPVTSETIETALRFVNSVKELTPSQRAGVSALLK